MHDTDPDMESLQKRLGLPATVGKMDFRLIRADNIGLSRHLSDGIAGRVRRVGGDFDVDFDDRCVLRVEPTDRRGKIQMARLTIRSCQAHAPFIILVRICLATLRKPYFMIPAVMYGTNNAGRGVTNPHQDALGIGDEAGYGGDPQLDYRGPGVDLEKRLSPDWHFRADRSAAPMVYAHTGDHAVTLGIRETTSGPDNDWTYNSLGIWSDCDTGDAISVAMGALDWPGRVIRHQLSDAPVVEALEHTLVGRGTEIFVSCEPTEDRFSYEPVLEAWHGHLHEPPRPGPPPRDAISTVIGPLLEDGIDPASGYFCMFRDRHGVSPVGTLLAWAGILQIAEPLMRSCSLIGNEPYLKRTRDMVDRAVTESFNDKSDMFFDVFENRWQVNTWWPSLGHAAVVNGHACWLILKMDRHGFAEPHWVDKVRRSLLQAVRHQRDDGRLPSGFSPDTGEPNGFYGYGGCFFVAPLLVLAERDADDTMRDAATRALDHYWREFSTLEWPGVDLDCRGAVDSGSSYALIRALVEQHRQTGDVTALDRLTHAMYYECSYRFAHNTRHRFGPCDWSSSGSRVTSTHNVHLDAYGGLIVEEMAYLVRHTGHVYFQQRLDDAFTWARQAYNREDREYGYGKKGWVVEQTYHTYDTYHHPQCDGAVWEAYFPWSAGALLNAFLCELDCPTRA